MCVIFPNKLLQKVVLSFEDQTHADTVLLFGFDIYITVFRESEQLKLITGLLFSRKVCKSEQDRVSVWTDSYSHPRTFLGLVFRIKEKLIEIVIQNVDTTHNCISLKIIH